MRPTLGQRNPVLSCKHIFIYLVRWFFLDSKAVAFLTESLKSLRGCFVHTGGLLVYLLWRVVDARSDTSCICVESPRLLESHLTSHVLYFVSLILDYLFLDLPELLRLTVGL